MKFNLETKNSNNSLNSFEQTIANTDSVLSNEAASKVEGGQLQVVISLPTVALPQEAILLGVIASSENGIAIDPPRFDPDVV